MDHSSADPATAATILFLFIFLLGTCFGIAMIAAYVRILQRAGYSGWMLLLAAIPVVNIVALFSFAFHPWPVEVELARLRAAGQQPGYAPYPYRQPPVTGGWDPHADDARDASGPPPSPPWGT